MWEVEFTDEFGQWWQELNEDEQDSVAASVGLLRQTGPGLSRPHADTVNGSRHPNMKELRTQHQGRPLRRFFAFDPRRCAILLIGGDKTGDIRFYERMIPQADRLYDEHLEELKEKRTIVMRRKFNELEEAMSPERRVRIEAKTKEMMAEMVLAELRKYSGLTQEELAASLGIKQPTLSRLEGQTDMQISTLRRLIEALGGNLELIAHLPGGDVRIKQFMPKAV